MYNLWSSSPALTNCTFSGNRTATVGGGMQNVDTSTLPAAVYNVLTFEQLAWGPLAAFAACAVVICTLSFGQLVNVGNYNFAWGALIVIGGFARQLAQKLVHDERCHHKLVLITQEVDRLEKMLGEVKDITRRVPPQFESGQISGVIRSIREMLEEELEKQNIRLELELSKEEAAAPSPSPEGLRAEARHSAPAQPGPSGACAGLRHRMCRPAWPIDRPFMQGRLLLVPLRDRPVLGPRGASPPAQ